LNHWIIHYVFHFANVVFRYWDRGIVELLGPLGLVKLFHYSSFKLELIATGFIPHYAFLILLMIPAILGGLELIESLLIFGYLPIHTFTFSVSMVLYRVVGMTLIKLSLILVFGVLLVYWSTW
jgi:hypothetical protein